MINTPPPFNNNTYQGYTPTDIATASSAIRRVYLKMTLALLVTAFTALGCYNSPAFWSFMQANSWAIWGLFIVELILVFAISGATQKMSTATGTLLFYLFALVNGIALTPIFIVYTHTSIAKTFFITAATFGAMSVYGYFTVKDLTRWGSILIMSLFGLIIAAVVNMFLRSSGLDWIISIVGVLIFVGLTAWDTQRIKQLAQVTPANQVGRLATIGALNLYLDFINLFLYLLRFFGSSRD